MAVCIMLKYYTLSNVELSKTHEWYSVYSFEINKNQFASSSDDVNWVIIQYNLALDQQPKHTNELTRGQSRRNIKNYNNYAHYWLDFVFQQENHSFKTLTLKHNLWVRGNPVGYPSEFV